MNNKKKKEATLRVSQSNYSLSFHVRMIKTCCVRLCSVVMACLAASAHIFALKMCGGRL